MNRLLINEQPLQVSPSLAKAIGLNEALFLQQLHWRLRVSNHVRDGRRWIYRNVDEWVNEFPFWSKSTIRRIVKNLRDRKLVITTSRYNKLKVDRTLWYSVDYAEVKKLAESMPDLAATEAVGAFVENDTPFVENDTPSVQNEHMTSVQNEQMDVFKMSTSVPREKNIPREIKNNSMSSPTATTSGSDAAPAVGKRKRPHKSRAYTNPDTGVSTNDIKDAYIEMIEAHEPGSAVNIVETMKWSKVLAEKGWKPEHIKECYTLMKDEDFWAEKHISLEKIALQIGSKVSKDRPRRKTGMAAVEWL